MGHGADCQVRFYMGVLQVERRGRGTMSCRETASWETPVHHTIYYVPTVFV